MSNYGQHRLEAFETNFRTVIATFALTLLFASVFAITPAAQAQSYQVLHNFTGGGDGATPTAGVVLDTAGNLYGTASAGGRGAGTVYELKRHGTSWLVNPLYSFTGGVDGAYPFAGVVFGQPNVLYGTTFNGGDGNNGVVFKLNPPPSACHSTICPWTETVLYRFPGGADGGILDYNGVVFDQAGNMYGSTSNGGSGDVGIAWELTPPNSWNTETVLYSFGGLSGSFTDSSVIIDNAGNLYGASYEGGQGNLGVVFQLVPSGPPWTENVLHNFTGGDGGYIIAGLILDSGNLYGAASAGGMSAGGTIFELSPSGGGWSFNTLYSFVPYQGGETCPSGEYPYYGPGPWARLSPGGDGNLYGTTCADGAYGYGNVFELSPSDSGWTYTDLYDFCALGPPCSDGAYPISNVSFDTNGNLYGTASTGGSSGVGVVWEITL